MSDEMTTLPFGEGIEAVEGELTSIRRVRGDEFPISTADCFALAKLIRELRTDLDEERRSREVAEGIGRRLLASGTRAVIELRERTRAHQFAADLLDRLGDDYDEADRIVREWIGAIPD